MTSHLPITKKLRHTKYQRMNIITQRLTNISKIIVVSGGKGGIGKSLVASTSALILSKLGYSVGLFDLDFTGPSTHLILGIPTIAPKEDKGILPPDISGIKFMSIISYSGDNPIPLRGVDVSNSLIELLTITRWGHLDALIVDTPPGIGDTILDTIRFMKKAEFLLVTTPSIVAVETLKKTITLLQTSKAPILGVIENMATQSSLLQTQIAQFDIPYLGGLPYDTTIEDALGSITKLWTTPFTQELKKIILTRPEFNLRQDT